MGHRHRRLAPALLASLAFALFQVATATSLSTSATPTASVTRPPSLVQAAGATERRATRSLTARFGRATGTGDLLVLTLSLSSRTRNRVTSVADPAGNTWQRVFHHALDGGRSTGEMWASPNARATSRVTVRTRARAVVALDAGEYSGVAGVDPIDAWHGAQGTGRTASSGLATGSQLGDLAVGFVAGHRQAQPIRLSTTGLDARPQRTSRGHPVASLLAASTVAAASTDQAASARFGSRMPWQAGVAMFKPAVGHFSVTSSPATISTVAGFPVSTTVDTAVTDGATQPVTLRASGLPVGTTASFSPATVAAGESSTLTIHTSVSTPPGARTVTVTGTGSSTITDGTLALDVAAPTAVRAAFYYPWFPQTWGSDPTDPHTNYLPVNGFYSSDDLAVVSRHVADMQYGGITLGLASWWGQGTSTDKNMPTLMQAATGTGFQWAPYYEHEGVADPTPQQIADDLHYLWATYPRGRSAPLASLPGKGMPVFVYNTGDDATTGCQTIARWTQARQLLLRQFHQHVYIDLKVFDGYKNCPGTNLVDGWHQYGPASGLHDFSTAPGQGSVSISPGYWKRGTVYGTAPVLARDRARWQSDLAQMLALHPVWQLVTTYNEWGEGTAIEGSTGCRVPAPTGTYCDWSGDGTHSDFIVDLHDNPPE